MKKKNKKKLLGKNKQKIKIKDKKDKKPKFRKKYEKMKCKFIKKNGKRCGSYAVGKSTLCEKHGGNPIIKANLILTEDMTISHITRTKFNPAIHPLQYIDLSRQGLCKAEIAAKFEVSPITLGNWCQTYKEMQMAAEIGENMNKSWWIEEGKCNLDNNRYNTGMYKFLTGNLLGFSDKIESHSTNLSIHGVLVVPDKMSPEEWQKAMDEQKEKDNAIEAEIVENE